MKIRPLTFSDRAGWRQLRIMLWPNYLPADIDAEIDNYFAGRHPAGTAEHVLVAERADGTLGGFVEVGLRHFADECRTTPVGYLEGWYVEQDLRRQGVGRALVTAAESWAVSRGCLEMASDCNANNSGSYLAHLRLGYAPVDTNILFRKPLNDVAAVVDRDWIAIVAHDLSVATAVKLVSDAGAGGIDVFLGTTRAERSPDGRELLALDYEAYEQMALEQMHELVRKSRQRWPIVRVAFLHRIGRVHVGEPSVIIAVATPHRSESFHACQFLIDQLKVDVPIWKQEVWSDGQATWVHPTG